MTAVRYMVVCEHPARPPFHVADITDNRPEGGIRVEEFRDHGIRATPRNRLGSRRQITLACPVCEMKAPMLADTSISELLDKLAPVRDRVLRCEQLPVEVLDIADPADAIDVALGEAAPKWVVVGEESRYLLPLDMVCTLITGLRDRGRRR